MTRETRIGLLVGLGFIILFGLILGMLNDYSELPRPVRWTEQRSFEFWPQAGDMPKPLAEPVAALSQDQPGGIEVAMSDPSWAGADGAAVVDASLTAQRSGIGGESLVVVDMAAHGAAPAVEGTADAAPKPQTYTVQPNDSLSRIAKKFYGSEQKYRQLFEANRDVLKDENTLAVGQVLVIPEPPAAADRGAPVPPAPARPAGQGQHYRVLEEAELGTFFAKAPKQPPGSGKTYVVRRGDNLTGIARRFLNDDSPAAVRRIYSANQDKLQSPDWLPVGVELKIPDTDQGA